MITTNFIDNMANIFTSSIGKKIIMSVSGLFLIVFLFVHLTINSLYLISEEAFKAGCDFMALPIVSIMVPVLALGFIIHLVYAFYLSYLNRKARGTERYAVANKAASSSFASKNMLVIGIIVLGVMGFHLSHFWAEMQLLMFQGIPHEELVDPNILMNKTFGSLIVTIIYLVWFAALWLHLTHGFWSALHTIGLNNDIWIKRWKCVSYAIATILCGGFALVAIYAHLKSSGIIGVAQAVGSSCCS